MKSVQVAILLSTLLAVAVAQSCSGSGSMTAGTYVFEWEVQDNGMYVDVNVSVNTLSNTWVAIGFSADAIMPNTDVVIGANDNTNEFIEDRWNGNDRSGPIYDPEQNIMSTSATRVGNILTISFTRPICSPDKTRDIDLDVCRWALWSWGGQVGSFPTGNSGSASGLGGHSARGVFRPQQLCLCTNFMCPTSAASPGVYISLLVIMIAAFITTAVVL